jgi:hypothetical protein
VKYYNVENYDHTSIKEDMEKSLLLVLLSWKKPKTREKKNVSIAGVMFLFSSFHKTRRIVIRCILSYIILSVVCGSALLVVVVVVVVVVVNRSTTENETNCK